MGWTSLALGLCWQRYIAGKFVTIYFYTKLDKYGDFSNFSKHGVEMDGVWFITVEHYFQAQKFENNDHREAIRNSYNSKQAAGVRSKP